MEVRLQLLLLLVAAAPVPGEWQDTEECGMQFEEWGTKIVGGVKAEEYEWPWQAAMYRGGRRVCGASLITHDWVITAAHCVNVFFEPEIFEFRVGSKSLTNDTEATEWRTASGVYVHPDYDSSTTDADIALFKMEKAFSSWPNHMVNTVCLPKKDMEEEFPAGHPATVTGWGALVQGGPSPDELYKVEVPIYDQTECRDNYAWYGEITDNMICAGVPEGGLDSCQGDSGGPMVALRDDSTGQYYLIGIVSWGYGCAVPDHPGVYTRVTQFEDWIKPIFDGDDNNMPTRMFGNCTADEFLCRGGKCIQDMNRCSGSLQCYYGTDEEFCDGLLKLFDVYYYEKLTNPQEDLADAASKETCADYCVSIGCRAFDVTPTGDTFHCEFALEGYDSSPFENDANRTFNHFKLQTQDPGTELRQAAGVIASPIYLSSPAAESARYMWNIKVTTDGKESIRFTVVGVRGESTCEDLETEFAQVSVSSTGEAEMTSFCLNSAAVGSTFSLHSTDVAVEMLTTDASEYGFLLDYESYYDCNDMKDVGPGMVTSPNYPSNYPNNVKCTNHLMASDGQVVYFEFDEMRIESHSTCRYDYVELYDGADENAPLFGRYCGNKAPGQTFQSSGTDMLLVFRSDGGVNDIGFKGFYQFGVATEQRDPTPDPNIAMINSLENDLDNFKVGLTAVSCLAVLLVIVLAASLYTVNKRDALSTEKLEKIAAARNALKENRKKRVDERYERLEDSLEEVVMESHGSQDTTKAEIISETGHADDYEEVRTAEEGKVNRGFVEDEKADNEEVAVAAFDAAIEAEEEEEVKIAALHGINDNTTVVVADIPPQPSDVEPASTTSQEPDESPKTQEEAFPTEANRELISQLITAKQSESALSSPPQQDAAEPSTDTVAPLESGDSANESYVERF